MGALKRILKTRCKWLYNMALCLYMWMGSLAVEIGSIPRAIGMKQNKYAKLKALKDKYKGERCFIIATGPSLTMEDLEALRNEYTFGMNSLAMLYEKTDWRATYMGIQDQRVYDKVKTYLEDYCEGNVLISSYICREKDKEKKWIVFPYNGKYHAYDEIAKNHFWSKFSGNCYRMTYDGYTITYSLIELACYMGFKEIYLLGADCNFEPDKKMHFIEHGVRDSSYEFTQKRLISGYYVAKEYADKHGIAIYNATRGGKLEVFPRVDFDKIEFK